MIKLIHRYKQSITIVFLFLALCFALSGIGLDVLHSGGVQQHPIAVNDRNFSYEDLGRAEANLEARYRQMFGEKSFDRLLSSLQGRIRQQAVDTLIDSEIMRQQAQQLGVGASAAQIRSYIQDDLFGAGANGQVFTPEAYANLLRAQRMSSVEFEGLIKDEIVRNALVQTISDVAYLSERDVTARFRRDKTKYSFLVAEYDTDAVSAQAPGPTDDELKGYYEKHAAEYELPAGVSYEYVPFTPNSFEAQVSVLPADIELYYADNSGNFRTPEQVKARSIQLLFVPNEPPEKREAVRQQALKVVAEARAGASFESLVAKYSQDEGSKSKGGERGWISRGTESEPFEQAVFSAEAGSVTEPIQNERGFEVVKIEEKKAAAQRSLDEVRGEVEQLLRRQEAPAYALAKAREFLAAATSAQKPLAEVAAQSGLSAAATAGVLEGMQDPSPELAGLTAKALQLSNAERGAPQLIELGDLSVVVLIKEQREPTTAPLEQVREKVVAAWKFEQAQKIADTKAQELVTAVKAAPATLAQEAAARQARLRGPFEISRTQTQPSDLPELNEAMRKEIFSTAAPNTALTQHFVAGSRYLVIVVTDIKRPEGEPEPSDRQQYRQQAGNEVRQEVLESTVALLKSRAEISVQPSVLTQ